MKASATTLYQPYAVLLSAQRRQLVVPPAPSAPSVPSVPSVPTVPRSAPSPPPAPSRCPDVRAERRMAPALAAKRVQ